MWLNSLCFLERWRSHSVMRFIGSRRRVIGKIRGLTSRMNQAVQSVDEISHLDFDAMLEVMASL
jgi:hypothetical protein